MKRSAMCHYLLVLLFALGCGKGELSQAKKVVIPLTTMRCGCHSEYKPVCSDLDRTYDNECIMKCYQAVKAHDGNCTCKPDIKVCLKDGTSVSECDLQGNIGIVDHYGDCSKATL